MNLFSKTSIIFAVSVILTGIACDTPGRTQYVTTAGGHDSEMRSSENLSGREDEKVKLGEAVEERQGQSFGVVSTSKTSDGQGYEFYAQTRVQDYLLRQNIRTLDREKADRFPQDWKERVNTPGEEVSAAAFEEMQKEYQIDTVLELSFSVNIQKSGTADFYIATAAADMWLRDDGPEVFLSESSSPMGTRGFPPSTGLTKDSAVRNALERAIAEVCQKAGIPASISPPNVVPLKFHGPLRDVPAGRGITSEPLADHEASHAELEDETWRSESISTKAKSPDGNVGVVAGYIRDTNFHRSPRRQYGSRIHLIDLEEKRSYNVITCHEIGHGGRGTRKILDAIFIGNWQYLAVVSGRRVFLFDTERGQLMAEADLPTSCRSASLEIIRQNAKTFLLVNADRNRFAYQLLPK